MSRPLSTRHITAWSPPRTVLDNFQRDKPGVSINTSRAFACRIRCACVTIAARLGSGFLFGESSLKSKRVRKHHAAPPTTGGTGPASPRLLSSMLFALPRRHHHWMVPAGDPSAFMAGGAWGPSGPPVNCLMSSRLAATHRPPPALRGGTPTPEPRKPR